jgi:hypothetical protein
MEHNLKKRLINFVPKVREKAWKILLGVVGTADEVRTPELLKAKTECYTLDPDVLLTLVINLSLMRIRLCVKSLSNCRRSYRH